MIHATFIHCSDLFRSFNFPSQQKLTLHSEPFAAILPQVSPRSWSRDRLRKIHGLQASEAAEESLRLARDADDELLMMHAMQAREMSD